MSISALFGSSDTNLILDNVRYFIEYSRVIRLQTRGNPRILELKEILRGVRQDKKSWADCKVGGEGEGRNNLSLRARLNFTLTWFISVQSYSPVLRTAISLLRFLFCAHTRVRTRQKLYTQVGITTIQTESIFTCASW